MQEVFKLDFGVGGGTSLSANRTGGSLGDHYAPALQIENKHHAEHTIEYKL
jgi:hypothetical protein